MHMFFMCSYSSYDVIQMHHSRTQKLQRLKSLPNLNYDLHSHSQNGNTLPSSSSSFQRPEPKVQHFNPNIYIPVSLLGLLMASAIGAARLPEPACPPLRSSCFVA